MDNEKVFEMSVGKVYPLLVAKAERKGRNRSEVDEVTCWLTGYTKEQLDIVTIMKTPKIQWFSTLLAL